MPPSANTALVRRSNSSGVRNFNDPRSPETAKKYVPPIIKPEDLPFDFTSTLAIIVGILGVMLRQKLGAWVGLVLVAQSLANMRSAEHDLKQIVCALTFAGMGFITNYFGPPQVARP
eukprot:TRINITY_DN12731_c0_g2_i1.p1 TRINITY_DN12731_c0_g2~~TRINITY_DN12731_c0_g2_i1.p1  ORF type:complete len:135 (-),score=31.22 TRINITY_DN12731_c0_g2_i1:611-961(-)